jgi:tetrapyrrole methylase family protein / MazG family protein
MNDSHRKRSNPVKPSPPLAEEKFRELLDLVARLRSPAGCPWDRSRKKGDIAHYLLEESYEVIEALAGGSPPALMEELGDLLFHILFLARMAEEEEDFDIAGVLNAITEKMIRRHPHVFGDTKAENVEEVRGNWERIKREVEHKGTDDARLFDGIPRSLPTLAKAQQITARASAVGFDWNDIAEVLNKVDEELREFRTAMQNGDQEAMHDEAGDLLFTLVNLCRFIRVDAESTLRMALGKFTRRFAHVERALAERGKTPADSSLAEMDVLWNEAKAKLPEGKP